MLKVIIVDDEVKVCKLIYHLVDWESKNLEVSATATDGMKALEAIKEIKPQIVITDIRMPGYDGIELIRRAKEISPDIYFIIISGHSEFEYAQNAIKYGVENYLLKPINKTELNNTLDKIIEKITLKESDNTQQQELRTLLKSSEKKAKKSFLIEILSNSSKSSDDYDISKVNHEYYTNFRDGSFTAIVISPFLKPGDESEEMTSLLPTKILSMLNEKLEPMCHELISVIWKEQIICLINADIEALTSVKTQLNKMKVDIAHLKNFFQEVKVIIGIGDVTSSLSDIISNIEKAKAAVRNRFHKSNAYIIEYKDLTKSKENEVELIGITMKDRILSCFETLNTEGIVDELYKLQSKFEKNAHDGQLIYNGYNELVNIFLFGINHYFNKEDYIDSTWHKKQFDKFYTLEDMFSWLKDWVTEEFEKYLELKENRDKKPIYIAKQYIKENYNKSISLEDISSITGFNSTYFSSMFKKETGEKFIDYLVNTRIENAKLLLLNTDFKVSEVAEEVGYSDIKYFTKVFKKKTGLNPTEFRKLYD